MMRLATRGAAGGTETHLMSLSWSSLESHSSGIEGGRGKGGEVDAESGELPAEDRSEALPLVSLDECPRTSARYQAKPPARWSRLSALPLRESCEARQHRAQSRTSAPLRHDEGSEQQKTGNMRSRWLAEEMGTLLAFPSGVTGDGIGGPADRARMGMGIGADGASSIAASPLTCEPCG
eukprot:7381369-Prymnesium_polylepis.1